LNDRGFRAHAGKRFKPTKACYREFQSLNSRKTKALASVKKVAFPVLFFDYFSHCENGISGNLREVATHAITIVVTVVHFELRTSYFLPV